MIRNLAENDDLKMLKPNLIICLIQEDYGAAKPDGEMDEARAVKRGDPADYDWPDPRSILPWITSDHKALFYELFFWENGAGGESRIVFLGDIIVN